MYKNRWIAALLVLAFTSCDRPDTTRIDELGGRIDQIEQAVQTLRSDAQRKQAADATPKWVARLNRLEQQAEIDAATISTLSGKVASTQKQIVAQDSSGVDQQFALLEKKLSGMQSELAELETTTEATAKLAAESMAMSQPKKTRKRTTKKTTKKKASGKNKFETTVFSWNVESEGSDPEVIAGQLAEMNRYDVYGLSEVLPAGAPQFLEALGPGYESLVSRSGYNDRLQLIYSTKKYRLLRDRELDDINFERRYRSPLVAHLEDKKTGQQVLMMVNHLARGRAQVREMQAMQLVEWAREQTIPVVAVGDYNFDFVFKTRKGNGGFTKMMRDGIWKWVEPNELIDTNWFDNPSRPDGVDDYPGSILDFAFVAGAATEWKSECRVIVRPNDFPDDKTTSDHRPFELHLIAD